MAVHLFTWGLYDKISFTPYFPDFFTSMDIVSVLLALLIVLLALIIRFLFKKLCYTEAPIVRQYSTQRVFSITPINQETNPAPVKLHSK